MTPRPSANAILQAAVDRFSAAAQTQSDDLHDATGTLLEALANQAQGQVTRGFALIMERLDRIEERMKLHQRHLEQIDLVLDALARERAVGE